MCVEPSLLHNLAVIPATHQPGSEEQHGYGTEIDKDRVCELLEAGKFGLVYCSFMINEEDVGLSRWARFFSSTMKEIYAVVSAHHYTGVGKATGSVNCSAVSLYLSALLQCVVYMPCTPV